MIEKTTESKEEKVSNQPSKPTILAEQVSMKTLNLVMKRLNRMNYTDQQKMEIITNNSTIEVWAWMEDNNVNTYKNLKEKMEEKESEESDINKIIISIMTPRLPFEKPETYITKMEEKLKEVRITEQTKIQLIANLCYTTRMDLAMELKNATSVEEMRQKSIYREILSKRSEATKVRKQCYKCNRIGHISKYCRAKPENNKDDN